MVRRVPPRFGQVEPDVSVRSPLPPDSGRPGNTPRPIDTRTRDEWIEAASQRQPPRPRDRDTLRQYLFARSPRRYRRLQNDMRWAEAELAKLGMNPEDARWVLP